MKRLILVALTLVMLMTTPGIASAHSGGTDASGGHYCRTNCEKYGLAYGQYHYHGGRSAPTPPPPPPTYYYNGVGYNTTWERDQARTAHEKALADAEAERVRIEEERVEAERLEAERIEALEASETAAREAQEASVTAALEKLDAEKEAEAQAFQEEALEIDAAKEKNEPEKNSDGVSPVWIVVVIGGVASAGYFLSRKSDDEE